MALWLKRRPPVEALYGRIVAQARQTAFYQRLGVPDSLEGRFEMLALHLFLVLQRLRLEAGHAGCAAMAQGLVDRMVADLDANLREMGAGDLGVGRKVKHMTAGLYGRIADYEQALDGAGGELEAALARRIYGSGPDAAASAGLALYVRLCRGRLAGLGAEALAAGEIAFPPVPEASGNH